MEGLLSIQWSRFDVRCIPLSPGHIYETDTDRATAVENFLHAIEVLVIHFQKSNFFVEIDFSWIKSKKKCIFEIRTPELQSCVENFLR